MLFVTVTITVPQKQGFPSLSTTSIVFAGELKLFRASNTSVWCSDFVKGFFFSLLKLPQLAILLLAFTTRTWGNRKDVSAEGGLWEGWGSWDQDRWWRTCNPSSLTPFLLERIRNLQLISPARIRIVYANYYNFLPFLIPDFNSLLLRNIFVLPCSERA